MKVADIPSGYKEIPEEDRKKAKVFFDRGKTVADTGNFDYAIEMFAQGLSIDPDSVEAHQILRDFSLKRKASGGKPLGMFEAMKLKRPTKDEKLNMLNAEKLLAYDPGDTGHMLSMFQSAHRAGFYDSVLWIGPVLQKANADGKPDYGKFIILRDVYKDLAQTTGRPDIWKLATDACHYAAMLRPDDMDLQTELKNLGAQHTMSSGKYGKSGSFRDSIRDMDKQQKLLDGDKDVHGVDSNMRAIRDLEKELAADPQETSKLIKLVDVLEKTEDAEYENRAIELLQDAFECSKQFRFRQRVGKIQMKQWIRHERTKFNAVRADPKDEALRKDYAQFDKEKIEFELAEYQLWMENYPTDNGLRYEIGRRLFKLGKYDEAIPVLQHARGDPKFRFDATVELGRAFLEAGYVDEADETLAAAITEYQLKGDSKSKEMYYWRGRTLEQKKQNDQAIKLYSQVAQWDFNYRDVQKRIRNLRGGSSTGGAAAPAGGPVTT